MLISCDNGYDNKRNRKKTAAAESADTDDKHPTKVGLYSFHLHAALRAEWIRNTGDSKYANDMQAAKGNMAVCSEHFSQVCRYNGKESIHRRPITFTPTSIFLIKETSCVGTPAPKPRSATKATASVRR